MSIILQALKKTGQTPPDPQQDDSSPAPADPATPSPKRPPVQAIAVVFFLLVTVSLLVYLIINKNREPNPPPVADSRLSTPVLAARPPAPVPPPAARPVTGNGGASAPLASEMAGRPPTALTPAQPAPVQPKPTPDPTPGRGTVVTADRPLTLDPSEVPERVRPLAPVNARQPVRPTPKPLVAAPTPAAPPPAPEPAPGPEVMLMDVPLLLEKPFEFQQSLPSISIDVHVYSDNPSRRFAMINMKKYREKDQIGQDLFLHTITPDGVVIQFRGELVKIPAQ